MSSPDPILAQAYTAARYQVQCRPRGCTLRIGARHARLDRRLRALGCRAHWHLLTAYNPHSQTLPDADNRARQRALGDRLARCGWRSLPASGQAADGRWCEPGWCLLDAEPARIRALARLCGQAAMVVGRLDGVAALLWLSSESSTGK